MALILEPAAAAALKAAAAAVTLIARNRRYHVHFNFNLRETVPIEPAGTETKRETSFCDRSVTKSPTPVIVFVRVMPILLV